MKMLSLHDALVTRTYTHLHREACSTQGRCIHAWSSLYDTKHDCMCALQKSINHVLCHNYVQISYQSVYYLSNLWFIQYWLHTCMKCYVIFRLPSILYCLNLHLYLYRTTCQSSPLRCMSIVIYSIHTYFCGHLY